MIALNIETRANVRAVSEVDPVVKLGRLKDKDKIKEKEDEARSRVAAKAALDPFTGELACLTVLAHSPQTGEEKLRTFDTNRFEEKTIIEWIWQQMAKPLPDGSKRPILTFNGGAFDIPFLQGRSYVLGIKPLYPELSPYRIGDITGACGHIDLYRHFDSLHPADGLYHKTLGFYSQSLLSRAFPFEDIDQSKFHEDNYRSESGMKIVASICEWNAQATFDLYKKIAFVAKAN